MFSRRLSDFRREYIDDQIVENFVVQAKVPHRKELERDYLRHRWDDALMQVDLEDLVQHRRAPVVERTDARIVADVLARGKDGDVKPSEQFGWALGTLVWNARRQAEWSAGELQSAVEDVVSGRAPADELVARTRDFPVLLTYVIRYATHLPHADEILDRRTALAIDPGVPRLAEHSPDRGPEWALALLSGLAKDRALRGVAPVETTAREA